MSGRGLLPQKLGQKSSNTDIDDEEHHSGDDRLGQWIRRRCLDGALNRAPEDFYPKFWTVLDKVRRPVTLRGYVTIFMLLSFKMPQRDIYISENPTIMIQFVSD